jgi:hypothetical protein
MDRLRLFVICFGLFSSITILVGGAQYQLTIDATRQPSLPARGRGPFPGSPLPGNSVGFPVRLDLFVPTGKLEPNGTTLVDFVITNIGAEPIKLPSSVDQNISGTHILTLYLTSDAISDAIVDGHFRNGDRIFPMTPTSAELYGKRGDPRTFYLLAPNEAIRVHASTRFELKPGTHLLTAHAEFLRLSEGGPEGLGTAESIAVEKMFSEASPTNR